MTKKCRPRSGLGFISAALLALSFGTSALAQGFGECYALQWGYDDAWRSAGGEAEATEPSAEELRYMDYYTWYCQAKPARAPTWDVAGDSRFHSYKYNRLDARDQALFRCERYATRCVSRCALAPKECAPHFWP